VSDLQDINELIAPYDRQTENAEEAHEILTQSSPVDKYQEKLGLTPLTAYEQTKRKIQEEKRNRAIFYNLAKNLAKEDDPAGALAYMNAAEYAAKAVGIDPKVAYRDLSALSQYWFGEIKPPDVFLKSLKKAWNNGVINVKRGHLAARLMEAGGTNPEIEQQLADLLGQVEPLDEIPRPWVKNALLIATESAPLMAKSFFSGGLGAAAGAAAGALIGLAAAPFTAGLSIPAIAVTMAQIGYVTGSTQELMDVMRGLQYLDLRDQGVPHEIATPIADISGIVQGAIESVGQMLLGVKLPGVTPALKSAGTMVANKLMMTGTLGTIATRIASNAVAAGLSEGIEEPLQEITSIFSEQLAMEIAKDRGIQTAIEPVTSAEFVSRVTEAFSGGFSAGVIFGVAGAPAGIRADVSRLNRIRELAKSTPDRAQFVNQAIREDLFIRGIGADMRGWRDYLGKVWAKEHPGGAIPERPTTAAETQARPQPAEGAEPAPRPEGEYRTKEGRLYVIEQELTATKEGRNAIFKVGDPNNRIRYGYILYEHTAGDIYIQEVVNEVEQDLRREMLLELAARHPEAEIEWNPTEEDEIAIKESIIADTPEGVEPGLQWYAAETTEPEVEITASVFVQRISEGFNLNTEEARAFAGVVEAFARARGMSANAYLQSFIGREVIVGGPSVEEELAAGRGVAGTRFETVEGEAVAPLEVDAEEFKTRVRALFAAMKGADLHIALHEFFHAVERLALSQDQIRLMEQALGKRRAQWTEQDLEFLADRFEDYLATGWAPSEAHRTLFEQLKRLLMQIVSFVQEQRQRGGAPGFRLSDELQNAFDALFITPEAQPEFVPGEETAPATPQERGAQIRREYEEYVESREDLADEVAEEIVETTIDPNAAEPEPVPTTTVAAESAAGIVELPIKDLQLSEEVPNFKEGADESGIVEPLGGEAYERVGTAPIVVWERTDGRLEVITGRHRLDLARRLGEKTIPAQIMRESEGFTAAMAMTFDAESNIRDGQGSVRDYANYFRFSEITEEEASRRGLLERNKGRTGFAIGRYATDGLYTLYRNEQINETKAAAIASAAPANESVQNEGIRQAKELNADELVNYLNIIQDMHPRGKAEQTDLFGQDDPFMLEAARLAREAVKKQAELQNEYRALKGALRLSRGEQQKILSKYGYQPGDAVAVQSRVDELTFEIEAWKDWTTDAEKHAELRERLEKDTLLHPADAFLFHSKSPEFWTLKSLEIITEKMQGPMQASAIKKMLQNNGVKADEMKWIGLDDFLEKERKITPEQMLEHIQQNNIQLTEVVLGKSDIAIPQELADLRVEALEAEHGFTRLLNDAVSLLQRNQVDSHVAYMDLFRYAKGEEDLPAKYLAIAPDYDWEALPKAQKTLTATRSARDIYEADFRGGQDYAETRHEGWVLSGGQNYAEILFILPSLQETYQTGHWEQENVVAHSRINERLGAGNENILFIEEIQSDWHQEGRKEGYQGDFSEFRKEVIAAAKKNQFDLEAVGAAFDHLAEEPLDRPERPTQAEWILLNEAVAGSGINLNRFHDIADHGIPDAPWRKTWHGLVFRRMLHLAVEKGYDRLAWTTGQQQADRYNLAQYIDEIRYRRVTPEESAFVSWTAGGERVTDTTYVIRGISGGRQVFEQNYNNEELDGFVGRDVAELIRQDYGGDDTDAEGVPGRILYTTDLSVGGEGMKQFYDSILVKYANKFAKKWGVKVEPWNVETDETPIEGTPTKVIPAQWPGPGYFTIELEGSGTTYGAFETREQAEAMLAKIKETGLQQPETVHSLPINNQMRKELGTEKSLYLFHQAEDQKRIIDAAKKYLGVTDNPNETGYIFPDGSMLDMSEGEKNYRVLDHGDALKPRRLGLKSKADDYFGKIFEFQKRSQAVRYEAKMGYASAVVRPTSTQIRKMVQGWIDNDATNIYLSISASDGRDQGFTQMFRPTVSSVKAFFDRAPRMLKHLSGEWAGQFIYGTEVDEEIWNEYVRRAKGYLSAEDFQAEIEEADRRAAGPAAQTMPAEEAARFYQAVWDEAHVEEEVEQEDLFDIPSPEMRDADKYDYDEKREAAQDIEDEELATKMERGEANDADLETPPEDLETTRDEAERAGEEERQARGELSEEGKRMVELGDEIDETIEAQPPAVEEPDETRQEEIKRYEEKLADLYKRFEEALMSDLSTAEALVSDMVWTRAIIMPSQIEAAEDVKTAAGEQLEKAVGLGRKLQKALDSEKWKKERAKIAERHKASRAKIYAKKREQFKRYKEQLRAKQKEQRAKKKYREAKKKIIGDIMRPPGRGVAYKGYAEEIRNIQRGLDPVKRQKKTLWRREQTRKFLEQNPEAAAYMDPDFLDKVYSVSLPDMTLEQLEKIKETIDALRKLGRLKRSLELTQERRLRNHAIALAQSTVLRGKPPEKPVGGVKPTRLLYKILLLLLKPDRVAKWFDGVFEGGEPGIYTEWLQDRPNEAWSAMKKMIRKRTQPVLKKMAELKLTADPLDVRRVTKGFTFIGERLDIEGFKYTNGKQPTIQDAMYWYIGMRNEKTAPALVHGNNIPEEILLKGIMMLTPEQRAFADAISADFVENFPRLRDAFIDIFNMDLPGEDFYVPMRRLMLSYETREEEIAMELTGRAGVRKQFIARNPTYARIDIADEHQKPIRTDLMSLWIEGVKIQEGFIHQDQLVKQLHAIFESDEVRLAVQQKYGPDFNKWLRQYINDLAQADAYAAMSGIEKFSRAVRTNAAVGWLAFNLSPHLKQLTGPLNYLADTGPFYLASAAAQFAAGKGKSALKGKFLNNTLVDFVDSKTELLQSRLISQEFADLQRVDKNLYMQFVKKIGHVGMHGLELIDKVTVYIGWKAVYDKEMAKHGIEAKAIQAADKATIRTQPSHRVQDMAQIYREGEILKWFMMFTSELSAIWNRMVFDVPLALKRHELMHALGDMVSFSIVGMAIAIAAGALQGDEPEEKKKKMIVGAFSQYIDAIPFFGNDIMNIVSNRQFQSGGVKIFPAIDYIRYVPKQFAQGKIETALGNLAEGAAFATGLPTSGPIKAVRMMKSKDLRDLLGWPREGR